LAGFLASGRETESRRRLHDADLLPGRQVKRYHPLGRWGVCFVFSFSLTWSAISAAVAGPTRFNLRN
jgi:hypothetical protein